MSPTEKQAFVTLLVKAFRMAGKDITGDPEAVADWMDEFADYPIPALDTAFRRHRRESVYPPKPADIYRYLDGQQAADGRPSADEAWGLLLRLIRDERETGVLSDEMREGGLPAGRSWTLATRLGPGDASSPPTSPTSAMRASGASRRGGLRRSGRARSCAPSDWPNPSTPDGWAGNMSPACCQGLIRPASIRWPVCWKGRTRREGLSTPQRACAG